MASALQKWLTFRPWQRHGLVLMVGGLVYISVGFGYLLPEVLSERRRRALDIALSVAPIEFWALCFIVVGFLAILSSRWPSFSDSWGYMVLTGLASGWSAVYITGYLLGPAPRENVAYGLVWGLVAFMWWAISGLVNPDKVIKVVEEVVTNGSD